MIRAIKTCPTYCLAAALLFGCDGSSSNELDSLMEDDQAPETDDDSASTDDGPADDVSEDDISEDDAAPDDASDDAVPNAGNGGDPDPTSGGADAGATNGGAGNGGAVNDMGGAGGASGGAGGAAPTLSEAPCDIYESAGTPCIAAYSPIRALFVDYTGPLYQVRSDSSDENRGTGGQLHDIGMTADGFADAAAVDAACTGTICTVSLIYDQSGNGNHLPVAKVPSDNGVRIENVEALIHREDELDVVNVAGRRVFSLFTEPRQGYSLPELGNAVPVGSEPQGIYLLADGTHAGTACCWDFGNALTPDLKSYGMNALMLGTAYWGTGAGDGPWFLAEFGAGAWAGGSNPGDPGWGLVGDDPMVNPANPPMAVPFALGFLKTSADAWSLRMADVQTAAAITTAYTGALPVAVENAGAIVLGVETEGGSNSEGTFFEGAIVAGFPSDETELQVLQNIQALGYGN